MNAFWCAVSRVAFLTMAPFTAYAGNFDSLMREARYIVVGTVTSESAIRRPPPKNASFNGLSDTFGAPSLELNSNYEIRASIDIQRVIRGSVVAGRKYLKICSKRSLSAGTKYVFVLLPPSQNGHRCLDAFDYEIRDFADDNGKKQSGVLVSRGVVAFLPKGAKFMQNAIKFETLNLVTGPVSNGTAVLDTFIPYDDFLGAIKEALE